MESNGKKSKIKGEISRREFLGNAGGALAFTFVPRHVLGGLGYTAPSEKVNIAGIGVGGQGAADIDRINSAGGANIVALCDVDERYAGGTLIVIPTRRSIATIARCLIRKRGLMVWLWGRRTIRTR